MIQYITKHCLFCKDEKCLTDLYPQTFKDEDINADVFSARRVTEHFHYKMVKCSNTGLVFSREILPDDILEKLYAESKVTFSEYTDIIRKDYWKPLEQFSGIMKKDTALEIGCSNGFFLEELQKQGFKEVHGCEPSTEAKNIAASSVKNNIHTGFFTNEVYKDNTFDLICCFQTLDHLSNPLDILKTCYNKLKPGGLIYIIVHNVDGLQAKIFGEKSPIIDVEHIYLFNPNTISLAVEKVGFKTVKTFAVKNSYPMEYWTSHAPLPFKKQFNSIFKTLGLNKMRMSLSLGNMGIVAVKK
jgi:2-polyprenyl-3-methyl-5-hydroxy-6-metoxy-1,4-benzoquinol methylase